MVAKAPHIKNKSTSRYGAIKKKLDEALPDGVALYKSPWVYGVNRT